MKDTSKVIMGATLVMVVTLAVVLGLILVLLAELYCSLLLRRRQLRNSNSNAIPTATTQTTTTRPNASSPSHTQHPQQLYSPPPPFSSIYTQGVLQAPRSILLPAVSCKEDVAEPKKQNTELHRVVQIQTQESNASLCKVRVLSASSQPKPTHEDSLPGSTSTTSLCPDKPYSVGEHLVYISNPIYENDESQASGSDTPFETPDTSPSRFISGSSEEDDVAQASPCGTHSPPCTPPLTPMKKLPAEACSVSLRDARSLGGSDSHCNSGISSSYSGSPCTSPSW
ncbi:uncharacterized protein LOC133289839 [Gastrolobium bilobum]|uniref:uncharacterized protein LOC133289839 n=1 Tax=Gastrolobium bilobum TaxID=150636 RepID=UPI002AB2E624|nr:uncharacterized protein LOC133289839 [Gastrolobium bilobum]